MERLHDPNRHDFGSDNHAGAHPEILEALVAANEGHVVAYGADPYTERLQELARRHFGPRAEAFPVFNGTGANVVALSALLPSPGAVICAASAHINTAEGGAPERVGGLKLLEVFTPDGRLTPSLLDEQAFGRADEHRAQPLAVSLTQATELGTVYRPENLAAVCEHAHDLSMAVHLDGARLANAAAFLDVPLSALSADVGVDIVSFGGTKNGLVLGEAVVVVNPDAVKGLRFVRKTMMQLASKARFVSAQLVALLEGDLWLRSAAWANAMALRLRRRIEDLPGIVVTQPTESNAVFVALPDAVIESLQPRFGFHRVRQNANEVRIMCAFDTTEEAVDELAEQLALALGAQPS
jgi:threonine aldolase